MPTDIELTPLESAGYPEGNAELAIRYENAETLGDTVVFAIDKREYRLKRDAKDPKRFASLIDFDFDRFVEEQRARKELIAETKEKTTPLFDGRELVKEADFRFIAPEVVDEARARMAPISIRDIDILLPPLPGMTPDKTLMITDLSVVQDPTRTFDICGNVGDPDGAWTFKTLMTEMANESSTGVNPAEFVEDWLLSWNVTHTINTFPVPARSRIRTLVLDPWPRDANGRLDLNQSPMRLLGIVNRVDLRSTLAGSSLYGGAHGIPTNAGEGRFVFGVVDRNKNGGCSKMDFTVILEYGVPIQQCSLIRNYANEWIGLSNLTLGSPTYNAALQSITDQFTLAGADSTKPNGSAINQIRTNEVALTGYGIPIDIDPTPEQLGRAAIPRSGRWELREFHLLDDRMLHIVSTKNTPHHSWNNTPLLASFINSGVTVVPTTYLGQPFLTGSTINFSVADSAVWNAPGVDNQKRHRFSLNTCNACHGGETRDNGHPLPIPVDPRDDTKFVHIDVRDFNVQSELSKFLTGRGTLAAPTTFLKDDPIFLTPRRSFGDLRRRRTDLAGLSVQSCTATGILQEALFRPMREVH
ncbi:MAG: hypothetical protein KA144_06920 [Xanthomonadaceae bacterium]|nr:hypothetical protein [Xanthomonadaceae bacterium]